MWITGSWVRVRRLGVGVDTLYKLTGSGAPLQRSITLRCPAARSYDRWRPSEATATISSTVRPRWRGTVQTVLRSAAIAGRRSSADGQRRRWTHYHREHLGRTPPRGMAARLVEAASGGGIRSSLALRSSHHAERRNRPATPSRPGRN